MAKKGDQARETVKNTIIEAFSAIDGFIAFQDKKIYVQVRDGQGGEMLQFAISMTMPKTPIVAGEVATDWTNDTEIAVPVQTELNPADKAKVEELKKKLGIID